MVNKIKDIQIILILDMMVILNLINKCIIINKDIPTNLHKVKMVLMVIPIHKVYKDKNIHLNNMVNKDKVIHLNIKVILTLNNMVNMEKVILILNNTVNKDKDIHLSFNLILIHKDKVIHLNNMDNRDKVIHPNMKVIQILKVMDNNKIKFLKISLIKIMDTDMDMEEVMEEEKDMVKDMENHFNDLKYLSNFYLHIFIIKKLLIIYIKILNNNLIFFQ